MPSGTPGCHRRSEGRCHFFPGIQTQGRMVKRSFQLWRGLSYLWAAPCTVAGLLPGLALLLCGARLRLHHGIIEIARSGSQRSRLFRFDAITLGHVVLGQSEDALECLRSHELQHVRQYERWGLLLFVAFPASSLWQLLRGKDPYWDNYFEVQARQRCSVHTEQD